MEVTAEVTAEVVRGIGRKETKPANVKAPVGGRRECLSVGLRQGCVPFDERG